MIALLGDDRKHFKWSFIHEGDIATVTLHSDDALFYFISKLEEKVIHLLKACELHYITTHRGRTKNENAIAQKHTKDAKKNTRYRQLLILCNAAG